MNIICKITLEKIIQPKKKEENTYTSEILKQRHVLQSLQIGPLDSPQHCILGFVGILVQHFQTFLQQDPSTAGFFILDFDILKVWVDAEREVARKCPRRCCPSKE